jgi:protein SCO1/2
MSLNFQHLQEKIMNYSDVKLISFSVDPARDSVPVLYQYAEKYGANPHYWKFLTADKNQIIEIATKGYFLPLDLSGKGKEFGITHSEMAVLVDKDLRIRNFYDLTNPNSIKTIDEDIRVLKFEYSNPQSINKK